MNSQEKNAPIWRTLPTGSVPTDAGPSSEGEAGLIGKAALFRKSVTRRSFLKASGTAAAIAPLAGCIRRPVENIMPYSVQPEYVVPGVPLHFASALPRRGDAVGLLVTSHQGRPTKVDGNPEHPAVAGTSDMQSQASLMDLYDPDRSQSPHQKDEGDKSWDDFLHAYRERLDGHVEGGGEGLRFLLPPTTSPTVVRARTLAQARFPQAKFHTYSALSDSNILEGAKLAFGRPLRPGPNYHAAGVILSIDSDFLGTESSSVRASRLFAAARKPDGTMNRLYIAEPAMTVTGAAADHRLAVPASRAGAFLRAVASALVSTHQVDLGPVTAALGETGDEFDSGFVAAVAADLVAAGESALVVVGSRQPPAIHALAYALTAGMRSLGRALQLHEPVDVDEPDNLASMAELVSDMRGGSVRTLVMLDQNPVYEAPGSLDFRAALESVEVSFQLSTHRDETTDHVTWHCNLSHPLESWSDHRSLDGTILMQQPLIAPLWGGKSTIELVALAGNQRNWRGHGMLKRTARDSYIGPDFERGFRRALHSGVVVAGGRRPVTDVAVDPARVAEAVRESVSPRADGIELAFAPCAKLLDGRQANNMWLLELPDPITKISWDNVAMMSKATADSLGVVNGTIVSVSHGNLQVDRIAAWVTPGHADNSVTLPLGWGRTKAGRYGTVGDELRGGGFDVTPARSAEAFWFATGGAVSPSSDTYQVARTQEHADMLERPLAISQPLSPVARDEDGPRSYRERPDEASYRAVEMTTGTGVAANGRPALGAPLWEAVDYSEGHRWGMAIDLSTCTGCNSCVIACQAENNVPSVGKRQIARGREMYWLRIDRYWSGEGSEASAEIQPIGCQHCEEAPCENVCPVNATAHSPEGLNDMAYNRCIGTRYCANNCPYKVRRFNYLAWHGYVEDRDAGYYDVPETRQMAFNPNVTVRMRGVMEKCSYCVQRIQEAKIAARRDRREMRDGDVVSACQQACPTSAIAFGDLNSETSDVSRMVARQNQYRLLSEVGTRPRTTFLSRVRNLNPAIAGAFEADGAAADEGAEQ